MFSAVCNPDPNAGAPVRDDAKATLLTVAELMFLGCVALAGESISSRDSSITAINRVACDQRGLADRCIARGLATTHKTRQAKLQAVISGRVPASLKHTLFCRVAQKNCSQRTSGEDFRRELRKRSQ